MATVLFLDTEIGVSDRRIHDIGAIKDGAVFHTADISALSEFARGAKFVCGHNIVNHDLKYIHNFNAEILNIPAIDTLYLSPLMFPQRPYHKLLKDDKLQSDQVNNPVNDCEKAKALFFDEVNEFNKLTMKKQLIYRTLLEKRPEFSGFFKYIGFALSFSDVKRLIFDEFKGKICQNAALDEFIKNFPVELAYALALISTADYHSVTPPWVVNSFPNTEYIIQKLCNTSCEKGCKYCRDKLDVHKKLFEFFGFSEFRTYDGEPLQERAAQAAVDGKSLLAVFPTGGGKSITFQLPALMAGQNTHGLTVVISPLQSLMKDQVDNLNEKGLIDAVTVNGMLSPVERAEALERVSNGMATLLYISPEQLRSRTIERLLLSRNVVRFVIDEAHCFSAWGQDFRVDYLYIAEFIKKYQKTKNLENPIPVSCFTATAKQKVISDICDYFRNKLNIELVLFTSNADRVNLHYHVLFKESEEEKYNTLRSLIEQKECPTIVYVSRVKRTYSLAERLTKDGFPALPYNGQMESDDKIKNQDAFMNNDVKIIVATSAFGMGVDKKDVKLVIHFDISDSLENYVQEAGRAGRDQSLQADCYVLFNNEDLDKHFILLNQTKLSISEIQQVWKAIKDMTRNRKIINGSPLEIARQAGWDENSLDIETRVKTAIAALENAGYVKRGMNMPRVYATSIMVKNVDEAFRIIENSKLFSEAERISSKRIVKALISSKSKVRNGSDDAESRVDYLADILGLSITEVIKCVNLMKETGVLADDNDMSAYIYKADDENHSLMILNRFAKIEKFLLSQFSETPTEFNPKEFNELAEKESIGYASVKNFKTLLYFLTIKGYVKRYFRTDEDANGENTLVRTSKIMLPQNKNILLKKAENRIEICKFIVSKLYESADKSGLRPEIKVNFSSVNLLKQFREYNEYSLVKIDAKLSDIEDALLYLSKIGAMKLEDGFLVIYNAIQIERLITDNKIKYKIDDYKTLCEYYKQKIQQIHIVGEYANLMVQDYDAALQFVKDYFNVEYKQFIAKYFKGDKAKNIERNITSDKYHQLFGDLSEIQSEIISDDSSKYIVVVAGPGSGKTKVLVHKLASLLLMEDVKHDRLLMLTFSRAAATEFKKRLIELIGNAACFVEIKTFHSYCFDLLGKIGSLENSENVVRDAAQKIALGEVENSKITKSVLVIDEAQDMDADEFALVKALMQNNDDMRVIAVGDDDQNIYEFRGSDSKFMSSFIEDNGAKRYEMVDNYRSKDDIVEFSNKFALCINNRLKQNPCEAIQKDRGRVVITKHNCKFFEEAIVSSIKQSKLPGRTCILTSTNDEAFRVHGLLVKNDIRAKLIQSIDHWSLYNLTEVRYFLKQLDLKLEDSPIISKEIWDYAIDRLMTTYGGSSCLENVCNMISVFESINPKTKYRNDLTEFIKESNYEDFYNDDQRNIFVSTIHKAKGREFENVYIMLSDYTLKEEAKKRALYVAITRAKTNLFIHCNNQIMDKFKYEKILLEYDKTIYSEPDEISDQLTHRDVNLAFFKNRKNTIFKLRSGQKLTIKDNLLSAEIEGKSVNVVMFSKAYIEKLENIKKKGYVPTSADVRFTLAWKGEEDLEESAIVLPTLYFKRTEAK